MYDLILFDLDGTLTLPEEGITKSVKYALESKGIIEDNQEKLKRFIGPPLVDGFMEFYGMSREDALSCVAKYRERFSVVGLFENELIDGVKEMLKTLKESGKTLVLATSKPRPFVIKILEKFELSEYFSFISAAEFDGTRNDKADVIKYALQNAGEYSSPVMVGDRMHDCIGAKKNNVPCVGVSYGYAEKGELEESGAIKICHSIEELSEYLNAY